MNFNAKNEDEGESVGEDRYLVFRIDQETFAAPLLSIREIVEPLTYQAVPNDKDYFLGLANLRGQIVGVLDLGQRFNLKPTAGASSSVFLIFDVDGKSMAGIVNAVDAVIAIPRHLISKERQVAIPLPPSAWGGIARTPGRLLPIIHLEALVMDEIQAAS